MDFAVDMVAAPITLLGGGLKPVPYTGGTLTVTLIDGKTGNVLWGNRVGYYGNIPMGENLTLSDTVSGALRHLSAKRRAVEPKSWQDGARNMLAPGPRPRFASPPSPTVRRI